MENIFKKFNEEFFSKSKLPIKWYDHVGVLDLDNGKFVQITLDDVGVKDNFNGYGIEVFNKTSGSIYKKFFRFQFHLDFIHRSENKYYHVYRSQRDELGWYISKPKDTKQFTDMIEKFIELWK